MIFASMLSVGLIASTQLVQPPPAVSPAPNAVPAVKPVQVTGSSVAIVRVHPHKTKDTWGKPDAAGINDWLDIGVLNFDDLNSRSTCLDSSGAVIKTCTVHPLALYLDGRELVGVPVFVTLKGDTTWLRVQLARDAGNSSLWSELLGNPKIGRDTTFWYRPTPVSVGLAGGGGAIVSAATSFNLTRLHHGGFFFAIGLMVLLLIGFVLYATCSDGLRELGPSPASPPASSAKGLARLKEEVNKARKPYSLARCQMAWWFLIVVASFLFIFLVTQSYDTINTTALALIGISATTFLSAAAVDAANPPPSNAVDEEKNSAVAAATPNTAAPKPRESKWFLPDILSDGNEQGFHRFQMVVWTVLFGGVFVISVWRHVAMPDFSTTLLGLIGISGATYVGFKIPENQAEKPPADPAKK